jgi:sugar transferase (PEP-CTERM system associated)
MIRVFNRYVSPKALFLMLLEGSLIVASLWYAARLRFWADPGAFEAYVDSPGFLLQAVTVALVLGICFYYNDLYDLSLVRVRSEELVRVGQSLGAGCILLGALYYLVPGLLMGKGVLFITVVFVLSAVTVMRVGLDRVWRLTREKNVIVLGDGSLAAAVAQELVRRDDLSFRFTGFVTTTPSNAPSLFGHPILGTVDRLSEFVRDQQVSNVVVAMDDQRGSLPARDLVRLRVQGIVIEDAHTMLAALTGRVWLRAVRPSWFVFSGGFRRSTTTALVKRALDLGLGMVGLMLTFPLFVLLAILIRLDSKGPVFYRQIRVGLGGNLFEVLKFRSMREDAEAESGAQWAQETDPRATGLGRILRKYRLDEIPQFINVIRGQMSLVGPRPERPVFVEKLREQVPFYDERHSVRPGVTGWAQVEYKYGSSVDDAYRKLEYDLFYLKNMSIMFDLVIVIRTVRIVLFGHGGR